MLLLWMRKILLCISKYEFMKGVGWQGLKYYKNDISFNKNAKQNPLTK